MARSETAPPTTTAPQGTTTTSVAGTTSTTKSGGTTATTQVAGVGASGTGGGPLAVTGASTRDLLSLGLLLLGIGLFVVGEVERRRSRA